MGSHPYPPGCTQIPAVMSNLNLSRGSRFGSNRMCETNAYNLAPCFSGVPVRNPEPRNGLSAAQNGAPPILIFQYALPDPGRSRCCDAAQYYFVPAVVFTGKRFGDLGWE